jgi:hypothetical protein
MWIASLECNMTRMIWKLPITLLNMVHIEELGDSMAEPAPLKQSTSQRKFLSRFDDYVLCIDCLKINTFEFSRNKF